MTFYYAFMNKSSIVTELFVVVGDTEFFEGQAAEDYYSQLRGFACKKTDIDGNFRKNRAQVGFTYDLERDAFISPKPYKSWLLVEETCQWEAPVPYPDDGLMYSWNEELTDWEATGF